VLETCPTLHHKSQNPSRLQIGGTYKLLHCEAFRVYLHYLCFFSLSPANMVRWECSCCNAAINFLVWVQPFWCVVREDRNFSITGRAHFIQSSNRISTCVSSVYPSNRLLTKHLPPIKTIIGARFMESDKLCNLEIPAESCVEMSSVYLYIFSAVLFQPCH